MPWPMDMNRVRVKSGVMHFMQCSCLCPPSQLEDVIIMRMCAYRWKLSSLVLVQQGLEQPPGCSSTASTIGC
jgi:hypothetical protein